MNTRFYNARIATMEAETLLWGEVWVEDGQISFVGEHPPIPQPVFEQSINLNGNLILPSFKNMHTHSPMVFARSLADDLPLMEWLTQKIFPLEANISGEDCYHLAKLAILEYVSGGITFAFDMYLYPQEVAQAAADCGFRLGVCGAVSDTVHSVAELEQQYLSLNELHPLVTAYLGFHAEYTSTRTLLEQIAVLAQKHKAPVYTHLSETAAEVQACVARYGLTPPMLLEQLGIWQYGGGGFHCVHMTEQDLALFARRGLLAVTNPASNCKLASGIAPLVDMQQRGIPIALGTDGAASNNALDFFREMYLALALQKVHTKSAQALPAYNVLQMATGGAEHLGIVGSATLQPGSIADLVVIDLNQPNMQPTNHVLNNLVYSGNKQNVQLTMINGKIVYKQGEYFVGEDPKSIFSRAGSIVKHLTKNI